MPPAVGEADDDDAGAAAAATSASGSGSTSSGSAGTPSARCTAIEALASSRPAPEPDGPVDAPASRSSVPALRASQAPSSTAAQSWTAPAKGTSTGPSPTRGSDDDADVAGRVLEQREHAGVLEQPVGCVGEQEVDVLLGGEAPEVDARRQREEDGGADLDAVGPRASAVVGAIRTRASRRQ